MPESIFAARQGLVYDRYEVDLHLANIVGGVPSNPRVIEGWIRTNLGEQTEEQLQRLVNQTLEERGIDVNEAAPEDTDEAARKVAQESKLNGFKRDANGLYVEGRHVKALIKEAANTGWPKRRWGLSRKGTMSWWAEHVFVPEHRIHLGVAEPSEVQQRFVTTWRGTSFVYEERVDDAKISFSLLVDEDNDITDNDWAELWLRAEQLGLGAVRSQGYGRFVVERFDKVSR